MGKVTTVEVTITREIPRDGYSEASEQKWEALAEALGITAEEAQARYTWCKGYSAPHEATGGRLLEDTFITRGALLR
jgi:hypothetical protein